MIEEKGLSIDRFSHMTKDIAYYNGKFYTDKAPGMSFMAYPSALATVSILKSLSPKYGWIGLRDGKIVWVDSGNRITIPFWIVNQVITLFTSGLITAFAALAIYFVALKLGAGLGGAVFASLAYGIGTPAWGWATTVFGHVSAGGCLFLGFTALFYLLHSSPNARRDFLLSFASGALLVWAVVVEFPSAPVSFIIGLYGLYGIRSWEKGRILRVLLSGLAGGLIFLTPLVIYNYQILGKPFGSLYAYAVYFPYMREGFFGLGYPDFSVVLKLLFDGKHGILWYSPLLIFAPWAIYALWKKPGHKPLAVILILIPIYYLLWNSSFQHWSGGEATTPRYLTPMLPFLCLPLALLWSGSLRTLRTAFLILLAASVLISLMSVSVSMLHGQQASGNTVFTYLLPKFVEGQTQWLSLPMMVLYFSPELSGYNKQILLVPLYLVMAVCLFFIYRNVKKSGRETG